MLREIDTRQVAGEPPRRWFASPRHDLIVWLDGNGAPTGFQLCYGKGVAEHALTWKQGEGFSHMAVDAGESRHARHKASPILVANGTFDVAHVLAEFRRDAAELPPSIGAWVEAALAGIRDRPGEGRT